jgi:hypothetical protein
MNKIKLATIGLLLFTLTSFASDNLPKQFLDLLFRSGLTFQQVSGLVATKIIYNEQMNYEYAIKYPNKRFEIRYSIRPLDKLLIEYRKNLKNKKKGEIYTNPNTGYYTQFQAIILNISGGKLPEIRIFEKAAVKEEFNADWGATTYVELGKEFGQNYKYCMVLALHKSNLGDAYIFYLSDSQVGFNELVDPAFYSLRFK